MTQKNPASRRKPIAAGERNAQLVAVKYSHHDKWSAANWVFQCDCGLETICRPDQVRRGIIVSCGCYRQEQAAERMAGRATHGHASGGKLSSEYNSWRNMRDRCKYPDHDNWQMYGGRGIKVCDRWNESFENFLADMGPKPSPSHTLGRIDGDGNYEPGNVAWATVAEQNRNRRDNRMVVYKGKKLTLAEACRASGIPRNVVDARLRRGWSMDRALKERVIVYAPR